MKTSETLDRVKQGEILTFPNLQITDLIEIGWYFEDDDQDHENFEMDYHNGQFRLNAVADTNDTYTIVGTTDGLGGIEGVTELVEKFDNTLDSRWVANGGIVELR